MIDAPEMAQAVPASTAGENVEPRAVFVRIATEAEKQQHGHQVRHVLDRCPGCTRAIPLVSSKLQKSVIIAMHNKDTPQGEIKCGYGGEKIALEGCLP